MRVDAVIFDMDGLMLDTEAIVWSVYKDVAAQCGLDMSDELFLSLIGRTSVDSERMLCEAFGEAFSAEDFRGRCSAAWRVAVADGIPTKPGLHRLLDLVDARGLRKAVATSTRREGADRSLAAAGIARRFEHVVTGDEVRNGKPAPDIFLLAAGRVGVEPGRCVVLEDSHTGIVAAHAAGCVPVMVPDLLPPTDEIGRLAHRVMASLDEVADWLEEVAAPHSV